MQITKLSFLSTQALGDNIFAVEEMLDIPIEQVFGTHKSRDKAFVNLIESDAVQKVSRDTWKIVKDITLDAANVTMRKGDFFRVRLDEQGDESPIHFDLDATGVFVLSRDVFASLQTYTVLEPGKDQRIRMQFTFGGVPVTDARLTSKFASMKLDPTDATNGIYELVLHTAMAPSDDILEIEVTGDSLRNTVYDAPVRITVREPVLTAVPIDMALNARQTKNLSWRLLMDGEPATSGLAVSAQADDHVTVNTFSVAAGVYSANVTAEDETGATVLRTKYDFGRGYVATVTLPLTVTSAPAVFVTQDTQVLEANQEQLIRFYVKQGSVPVPNAKYSTTDIRGPGLNTVAKELVTLDAATGYYAYRVTTNHKGGPIAVRTNITINGTPYPVFFDLTSKSTPITAVALNTLPAADTTYLEFRVEQERLGGKEAIVGVQAKVFTVTGVPVVGVLGSVEAVGQGVYRLRVTTNNLGGNVNVAATLTVDGEDHDVTFSTTAAVLGNASLAYAGEPLTGEMKQPVLVTVTFEGAPYDLGGPSVSITGTPLVAYGTLRRTGIGQYEIQDVDVNGKGGVLNITMNGKVKGYSQSLKVSIPVNSVSAVQATNITHFRPTTQGPLQFTALRDGLPQPLVFSDATVTGAGVASYTPTVEVLDASKGRYQIKNVVASAPTTQQSIGVSAPYKLRGYFYTLAFASYTEAMKTLVVDTDSVVLEGGKKTDYLLKFTIDDALVAVQASNVAGSGAFVSVDSPSLEFHEEGIYAVKGLLATEDRGSLTLSGTVVIDDITYPISVTIRVKDARPEIDNPDIPPGTDPEEIPGSGEDGKPGDNDELPYIGPIDGLEPEKVQTVFFKLAKKGQPVGDALIANGTVTGAPIEAYDGFALHDAATGTYRINITTNAAGGYAEINMDITIDGEVYPTTYRSFVQKGKVWALTSSTVLLAAKSQSLPFGITYGGTVVTPEIRNLDVSGATVKAADKDCESVGNGFQTNGIVLNSAAGDVSLTLEVSSNQLNWTPLSKLFPVAQAVAPTTSIGPMLPANATAVLTFKILRYGKPLVAPTITDLAVSGTPVAAATLDVIKLANGTYGTTVTTNELGGDIELTFNIDDDGVIYPVTLTGSADIIRPWSASLVNSPVPEIETNIDILSVYGGAPQELLNGVAEVEGDSVIKPTGGVSLIYQDAATGTYRIPGVLVNNVGGPVTFKIRGDVNNGSVSTVLQTTVTPLPELTVTVTSSELPFHATTAIEFTVQRGGHPSIFTSADATLISLLGAPVKSVTPTIEPVGGGKYRIRLETNGLGGQIDCNFKVTLAGTTFPLSFTTTAAVEPPVSAKSTNTMASNATGTNLDFQLMRGALPCADPFVVKTVTITGKSVTSYPQSVLNVDVSAGKYRLQVDTSAYSDAANVTITATVRGDNVTLNFQAPIAAGVLPTVTLVTDNFVQDLQSTATLSFKQGAATITGVTLESVEGPLDGATLSGTTLTATPSVAGAQDVTINYRWKNAVYTGVISINPIASSTEVPVDPENPGEGNDSFAKLKAYVPNDVVFKMKQLDGTEYPPETTFSVAAAPFTVTSNLARQGDAFKIGLKYDGELAETPIIVTATNGSAVVKHMVKLTVWYNLEARFSGTALLDSTQVSNLVNFDVYELGSGIPKDVYAGTDVDSLDVKAEHADDLVGFSTFQILSGQRYRGSFFVSTQPVDLANMTFSFHWTSPLGRNYTIPGTFRVQKAIVADWIEPTLKGGEEGVIEFTLKSGATAISDAVDAVTTASNSTVTVAPHVIDAAIGKYSMTVKPNGGTTTLSVTLKIKQAGLVSVLTAKSFPVAPGDFAATMSTGRTALKRAFGAQTMGVTFSQGGSPVAVTFNSITATGALTSLSTTPGGSSASYTWQVTPEIDVAGLHLSFNVTIGGVGMVLEMDYPIDDPVVPTITWRDSSSWTKGLELTAQQFKMSVGGVDEPVLGWEGTPYTVSSIRSDSPDVLFKNAYVDNNTAVVSGWLGGTFTPLKAGPQDMYMIAEIYGKEYRCKATIDVRDAATIVYESDDPIFTRKESEIVFTLSAPEGVTLDPTAIPTFTIPPYPVVGDITVVDGKYHMNVKPEAESNGVAAKGSIISGGNSYVVTGIPTIPARIRPSFMVSGVGGQTETAGGNAQSFNYALTDLGLVMGWDLSVALKNLRVTSTVPGALKATPAPAMVPSGNVVYGTAATNLVDYAMITWTVDILGRDTGHLYPDVSWSSVIHDSAVATYLPPDEPYIRGMTYDVKYKLTWLTSGNPVTMGMSAPADMKTIDAPNGIYAVPNVVMNAATVTVTPKWSFENSRNQYTGTAFTIVTANALTSTLPAYQVAPNGSVTTKQYSNLGVKVSPSAGLAGATIEGWTDNAVFVGATKSITATEDNLYLIPMTQKAGTVTPASGAWTPGLKPISINFLKDGKTTTLDMDVQVYQNTVPIVSLWSITTLGGEFVVGPQAGLTVGTISVSTGPIESATLYGMDGQVITGIKGLSTYSKDGRIRLNMPDLTGIRYGAVVVNLQNAGRNYQINVGGGQISPVAIEKTTVIGSDILPVGVATTAKFSLIAPAGVTYSNPTVTISENPWPTSGTLTDNGDGTYSITITPSEETFPRVIRLDVVQDGTTHRHGVMLTARDFSLIRMKVTATSDRLGSGNAGLITLIDKAGVDIPWDLSTNEKVLPRSSIKITSLTPGVTVGTPAFQAQSSTKNLGFTVQSTSPIEDYATIQITAEVISPDTGYTYPVTATMDLCKAVAMTWNDTIIPTINVDTVIPFTLKYTGSGNPVTSARVNIATLYPDTATLYPGIVNVDPSVGIYGMKIKAVSNLTCNLSINASSGNVVSAVSSNRMFTPVVAKAGATPLALVWTGSAVNGIYLIEQNLADKVITFTGDDLLPMTGVRLDLTQLPTPLTYAFLTRDGDDDWSKVLVPATLEGDGKYTLKLRVKGNPVSVNYFGSGSAIPLYVFHDGSPTVSVKYDFTVKVS